MIEVVCESCGKRQSLAAEDVKIEGRAGEYLLPWCECGHQPDAIEISLCGPELPENDKTPKP